jgi:hypothetical protein
MMIVAAVIFFVELTGRLVQEEIWVFVVIWFILGGILMDLFFLTNMIRNIISTFFQNGILVVGFFFLLIKIFDNKTLIIFSKYAIVVLLALLFFHSVLVSI